MLDDWSAFELVKRMGKKSDEVLESWSVFALVNWLVKCGNIGLERIQLSSRRHGLLRNWLYSWRYSGRWRWRSGRTGNRNPDGRRRHWRSGGRHPVNEAVLEAITLREVHMYHVGVASVGVVTSINPPLLNSTRLYFKVERIGSRSFRCCPSRN